jgi:hypothetical protein
MSLIAQKIIHKYQYSVYVTDYTDLPDTVFTDHGEWCPEKLRKQVIQFAFWGDTRQKADQMVVGEYWRMNNIGARWSKNGFVEGHSNDAHKLLLLDEEKADDDLQALLE